jgi:hypothetical protein
VAYVLNISVRRILVGFIIIFFRILSIFLFHIHIYIYIQLFNPQINISIIYNIIYTESN